MFYLLNGVFKAIWLDQHYFLFRMYLSEPKILCLVNISIYLNSSRSSLGFDDQGDSKIGLQVCCNFGDWVSSSSKYFDTVLSKSSKVSFSKTSSLSSEYSKKRLKNTKSIFRNQICHLPSRLVSHILPVPLNFLGLLNELISTSES